ncbi:MAG: phage portal protein [Chloroflexi bacterium]|nr:phage portal protein [Chloroflexota bacterium]
MTTLSDFDDYLDSLINGGHDPISVADAKKYVPWVRRAQTKRAGAIRAMPFSIMSGENDVTDTKERFKSIDDLIYKAELSLYAHGKAYWHKAKNDTGKIWPQWWVASSVKEVNDNGYWTGEFRRTAGGEEKIYPAKDLVYFWEPDEDVEAGPGAAPIQAALYAASTLFNSDLMVNGYFQRGGLRVTLFGIPRSTLDAAIDELKAWWARIGKGVRNAYSAVFYKGGKLEPTTVGDPLKDIWNPALTKDKREDIAAASGMPVSVLLSNATTFATADRDYLGWFNDFVVPRCEWYADQINRLWLASEGLELVFHPDQTEAWQTKQLMQVSSVTEALNAGIIDQNEARFIIGFPEIDSKEETPEEPEEIDEEATQKAALADDLAKWERYAARRYREGQRDKALMFTSAVIPSTLQAAIRGGLTEAESTAAIADIFSNVKEWDGLSRA